MLSADTIDGVFSEIGFGKWQRLVIAATLFFHFSIPVQQLGSTLMSPHVPFRCSYQKFINLSNVNNLTYDPSRVKDISLFSSIYSNSTEKVDFSSQCLPDINSPSSHRETINVDVPLASFKSHASGMPSCPFIEYDNSVFESTVTTEWDLVCENLPYRPLFQMAYSIGGIVGCVIAGLLSDKIGRKRTIQIGALLLISTVVGTGIASLYWVTICLRVLSAMGITLAIFPIYTLISEVSPSNRRTLTVMLPGLVYFVSFTAFGIIAYFVPYWRTLVFLCNWTLLLFVPITFVMDESPRWLLQNGRAREAANILKKAASQNRATITPSNIELINSLSEMSKAMAIEKFGKNSKDTEKSSAFSTLKNCFLQRGMRTVLIVTPLLWILKRALYTGIALSASNFAGFNPVQYVAFSGAMGVLAIVVSIPLSVKIPRKIFLAVTLAASGLLLLMELIIPQDYWYIKCSMIMVSFCLSCGSFQVTYIFTAELFPTVIRTRGFTLCNLIASVGEMLSPLITDIAVQYYWWVPSLTFGLMGVMGACLLPLLPETRDEPIPETFQDVEDRWRNHKGLPKRRQCEV